MKFFVTGATGFVGSHFVRHAIKAGHTILATYRRGTRTHAMPSLTWLEAELDALPDGCMADFAALVHFAAVGVSPKQATRRELTHWNVSVPLMLMEAAQAGGVPRVVIAGSSAEYGQSDAVYDLIPPDAPLLPTSAYAASKAGCFVASHAAAIELGLQLCYLRIFSAFGDGQFETNFWPALRKAAQAGADFPMTGGEQIRDFIPVEDVAREFLHAATLGKVHAGEPLSWNVGSGSPVKMREFAEAWWQRWNATGSLRIGMLPYRPHEVMRFAPLITERAIRKGELS
jgi:UDP-glucose 4-epimerase